MKISDVQLKPVEFLWKLVVTMLFTVPVSIGGMTFGLFLFVYQKPWDYPVLRVVVILIGMIIGTVLAVLGTIDLIKFGHKELEEWKISLW